MEKQMKMLTMKDIVGESNDILMRPTKLVPMPPSPEDVAELESMLQFLKNSQDEKIATEYGLRPGVGLAANQIGLDKSMFALYFKAGEDHEVELMLFNPKIISHSVDMTYLTEGEGCLSVDRDVIGYVPRYERIKVRGNTIDGKEVVVALRSFTAIVAQHEIDHLNGIMFYDRINKENPFKLPENVNIQPFG